MNFKTMLEEGNAVAGPMPKLKMRKLQCIHFDKNS